ncbi:MAG: hypothetical protein IKH61_10385 [Bacteroidales bacterium]|nr:hypothetical protein [Bacteroidales bacterium]
MEESGYNPIVQTTTGDSSSNYYNNDSSSLKTSMIELIKYELSIDYSNCSIILDQCSSMKQTS